MKKSLGLILLSLAVLASCAKHKAQMPAPPPVQPPVSVKQPVKPLKPLPTASATILVALGNKLYHSPLFQCSECHGIKGQGTKKAPALAGLAKKLTWKQLLKKAPPMCAMKLPKKKDFKAIAAYLASINSSAGKTVKLKKNAEKS
ncbi:MAG: cytochrome c [Firmicutes bacterium]|nr:cytochrome c [Bacillota bacterium]